MLHLIPTLEGGGAEHQLAMLAAEQANRGWDVHIGLRRGGVHESYLSNTSVVVHYLGDGSSLNPKLIFRINTLVQELKPHLLQSWLPQMDILGGFAALWNNVPWIISERASELAYTNPSWFYWLRCRLGRHASGVVANSNMGALYWQRLLSADAILERISNAVDVARIRDTVHISNEYWNDGKKLILVVGRLDYQKAVETTIHAVSLMPDRHDFRVLIIGDGPMREQLHALINSCGLDDRIIMLPFQPDWWGLLKIASILVSMSRFEGHPNVVLESMAAGCPLIVSDIPEHKELLSEDTAIMVPLENSLILAEAICSVLTDPMSATKRAECASKIVDDLTIHTSADAYESIYRKVMNVRLR